MKARPFVRPPPAPVSGLVVGCCSLCETDGRVVALSGRALTDAGALDGTLLVCRPCLAVAVGFAAGVELDHVQAWYLRAVLAASYGNKARAARVLGIHRRTLYRRLAGGARLRTLSVA